MSRLLVWAGNPYFAHALQPLGWELAFIPRNRDRLGFDDVLAAAGGRVPHLFVLGDESREPNIDDLLRFPCPTLFHAVDTHIHSWAPLYAAAFDLAAVAMRDHIPRFLDAGLPKDRILHSPLYAGPGERPPASPPPKTIDVLFAGKNDPVLTPGRHTFLAELDALLEPGRLVVTQGPFPELFPKARIVLNVAEAGDLNFRVFQALGCGACLLTPHVGHGLTERFTPDRDLFTYVPNDPHDAARRVRELLPDAPRREAAAKAGFRAVEAGHRAPHRAQALDAWLAEIPLAALPRTRPKPGSEIRTRLKTLHLLFAKAAQSQDRAAWHLTQAKIYGQNPSRD